MYIMSCIVTCVRCFNCYRSLKVYSKKSVLKERRQQKEPSGNHPSQQPHEHAILNTLTPTGLENSLTTLRELTECSAKLKLCTLPVVGMHPISPVYCLLFIIAWGVLECSDIGLFFCWQMKNLWLQRITLTSLQLCWKSGAMTWSEIFFCVCIPASFSGSQPHSQAQTMQQKACCWSGNEAKLLPWSQTCIMGRPGTEATFITHFVLL